MFTIMSNNGLQPYIISTNTQKVLSFLIKFSDREFYEREVARELEISAGSANRSLNELFSSGVISRRREGKMFFYSVNLKNALITELKKVINLLLIEPLVEALKAVSNRAVLYGSCARGTDTSKSDLDLFVVSNDRQNVSTVIHNFRFPQGYRSIHIKPVIKTPVELLESGEAERTFLEEIESGIVLWEKAAHESVI
jgi:predicted nucleotidyltransferase